MRQTAYPQAESAEFKVVQNLEGWGLGLWFGAGVIACVCAGAHG